MHRDILPSVIFSPAPLALSLAEGLPGRDIEVTLFTAGPVTTTVTNLTADLSYFEHELSLREDTYISLLKKHPFTFVTLARQVQSELIAQAFAMANRDELDIVHIYTNEEDIALPFAALCKKPVVFTHHDPFNFLVKYKNVFPKYATLNWISASFAQRQGMPKGTNWVGNIYHGIPDDLLQPMARPGGNYVAFLGRIIEPKGAHLAIQAIKQYNATHASKLTLKIAGKHYADYQKDTYWRERVLPEIDDKEIQYVGFINTPAEKQAFLGNAAALLVPSTFDEPFGMVMIEALACGTPLIGLNSGAIPEIVKDGKNGILVQKKLLKTAAEASKKLRSNLDEAATAEALAAALDKIPELTRTACRQDFEARFTAKRMCQEHVTVYEKLLRSTK